MAFQEEPPVANQAGTNPEVFVISVLRLARPVRVLPPVDVPLASLATRRLRLTRVTTAIQ